MSWFPPTVLIIDEIDDDPMSACNHMGVVQLEGCLVALAPTAAAGLLAADTGIPDAILLDLELPEVDDGLSVLRQLRAQSRSTPVAILAERDALDEDAKAEARDMGATIVFKPVSGDDCRVLVRSLLGPSFGYGGRQG